MSVLVGLCVVVIGGIFLYLAYRYWDAGRATKTPLAELLGHVSPTICTASWSGFDTAGTGKIYIYDTLARIDLMNEGVSETPNSHMLFDAQKNFCNWFDGEKSFGTCVNGIDFGDAVSRSSTFVLSEGVSKPIFETKTCMPWWNADLSVMGLPSEVEFRVLR
jgi:hypothetical protein